MNSDFLRDEAAAFAERLRRMAPRPKDKSAEQAMGEMISLAWNLAYQRPIATDERQLVLEFLKRQTHAKTGDQSEAAINKRELLALTNLCQQILSSNEFLYVD
jgi:hypothetical protein